jgi:hypothetical protein
MFFASGVGKLHRNYSGKEKIESFMEPNPHGSCWPLIA